MHQYEQQWQNEVHLLLVFQLILVTWPIVLGGCYQGLFRRECFAASFSYDTNSTWIHSCFQNSHSRNNWSDFDLEFKGFFFFTIFKFHYVNWFGVLFLVICFLHVSTFEIKLLKYAFILHCIYYVRKKTMLRHGLGVAMEFVVLHSVINSIPLLFRDR